MSPIQARTSAWQWRAPSVAFTAAAMTMADGTIRAWFTPDGGTVAINTPREAMAIPKAKFMIDVECRDVAELGRIDETTGIIGRTHTPPRRAAGAVY